MKKKNPEKAHDFFLLEMKDQLKLNRLPIESAALIVQTAYERREKSLKVLQSVRKKIRTRLA